MTTQTTYANWKSNCHTGNTPLYTEPNGGTLYIGGWNNDATFDWNTHVIDLTGSEHRYLNIPFAYDKMSEEFLGFITGGYAGWLSLPFPDYKTPLNLTTRQQWDGIAQVIRSILAKGTDVLVACHGGHGRSGLFCAIVGYILAVDIDHSWASPVEKIRKVHCFEAVETYAQEKFVYDILGLNIQITHTYVDKTKTTKAITGTMYKYEDCPICGTQSMYIGDNGMCLVCKTKFEKVAPTKEDLTLEDIKDKGKVEHECKNEKCCGIWKASKCGHVIHDQIIYEGWCPTCWNENEAAEKALAAEDNDKRIFDGEGYVYAPCSICTETTAMGGLYGICYECAEKIRLEGSADYVHNTITDPYRAMPHHCDEISCVGIVIADKCGHVIHNQEVEDGLCPECQIHERMRRQQQEVG
jgi:hypothetical protein